MGILPDSINEASAILEERFRRALLQLTEIKLQAFLKGGRGRKSFPVSGAWTNTNGFEAVSSVTTLRRLNRSSTERTDMSCLVFT